MPVKVSQGEIKAICRPGALTRRPAVNQGQSRSIKVNQANEMVFGLAAPAGEGGMRDGSFFICPVKVRPSPGKSG
jgi:hypothetical protein